MKLYKLECITEDGYNETNGYYLDKDNAEQQKEKLDSMPMNIQYGIEQHVIEIETED